MLYVEFSCVALAVFCRETLNISVSVLSIISVTRSFPFAEAMAAGVPVVAKKDECIENIITNNATGMLFESDEELPDLLYRVLTDKHLSARLSRASVEAMEALSVEAFADSVENLYQDILNSGDHPRKIAVPALPLVMGVKAVKGITKIPRRLVRHTHQKVAEQLSISKEK